MSQNRKKQVRYQDARFTVFMKPTQQKQYRSERIPTWDTWSYWGDCLLWGLRPPRPPSACPEGEAWTPPPEVHGRLRNWNSPSNLEYRNTKYRTSSGSEPTDRPTESNPASWQLVQGLMVVVLTHSRSLRGLACWDVGLAQPSLPLRCHEVAKRTHPTHLYFRQRVLDTVYLEPYMYLGSLRLVRSWSKLLAFGMKMDWYWYGVGTIIQKRLRD
jgi:hypothetical protein